MCQQKKTSDDNIYRSGNNREIDLIGDQRDHGKHAPEEEDEGVRHKYECHRTFHRIIFTLIQCKPPIVKYYSSKGP